MRAAREIMWSCIRLLHTTASAIIVQYKQYGIHRGSKGKVCLARVICMNESLKLHEKTRGGKWRHYGILWVGFFAE